MDRGGEVLVPCMDLDLDLGMEDWRMGWGLVGDGWMDSKRWVGVGGGIGG